MALPTSAVDKKLGLIFLPGGLAGRLTDRPSSRCLGSNYLGPMKIARDERTRFEAFIVIVNT